MENQRRSILDNANQYALNLESLVPGALDNGIQLIDGFRLKQAHFPPFTSALPTLIDLSNNPIERKALKILLAIYFPADMELFVLSGGINENQVWKSVKLMQLDRIAQPLSVFVPRSPLHSSMEEFMEVIARLRAPDGCPWDKKQTHDSLRQYLLEETYEALDALDRGDKNDLKEELGDILLQIALHAQIATEKGEFTISDILSGISRKIISRHPHVFGDVSVKDDQEVVKNWEKLKEIERAENDSENGKGLLDGIPSILPALSQAQVIQDRAARVGFDWPEIAPVVEKVLEEMKEVEDAPSDKERAGELGDLLFAVVNLVRWYKVDSESALRMTNNKFRRRFAYLEERSKASGKELPKMTLEEMDVLWEEAKRLEE